MENNNNSCDGNKNNTSENHFMVEGEDDFALVNNEAQGEDKNKTPTPKKIVIKDSKHFAFRYSDNQMIEQALIQNCENFSIEKVQKHSNNAMSSPPKQLQDGRIYVTTIESARFTGHFVKPKNPPQEYVENGAGQAVVQRGFQPSVLFKVHQFSDPQFSQFGDNIFAFESVIFPNVFLRFRAEENMGFVCLQYRKVLSHLSPKEKFTIIDNQNNTFAIKCIGYKDAQMKLDGENVGEGGQGGDIRTWIWIGDRERFYLPCFR